MKTKIISIATLLITVKCLAQDPSFTQFSSTPLYLNPSFAGSADRSRIALSYRNQWNNTYQTYHFSYDQVINAIHGGAGLIVYNDNSREVLNVFYTGLVYAPKFNVSSSLSISPSVKVGYRRTSINPNNLKLGEIVDRYREESGIFQASDAFKTNNNADISIGFMLNTNDFYAGFAIDHVNKPNVSLVEGGKDILPSKHIVQAGYTYQESESSNFSFSANALYQYQALHTIVQTNFTFRYRWALAGFGVAGSTALYFTGILGFYSKRFVVGYTYDYFTNAIGYVVQKVKFEQQEDYDYVKAPVAHEISVKYFFNWQKEKKKGSNAN